MGSWALVLGLLSVAKEIFTSEKKVVTQLREMSLPFYMIEGSVLVIYLAGAFWVPYLRSFPFTIILGTLITGSLSLLIPKAGPLRYFFGLHCPQSSLLPGTKMRGMIPPAVLAILFII